MPEYEVVWRPDPLARRAGFWDIVFTDEAFMRRVVGTGRLSSLLGGYARSRRAAERRARRNVRGLMRGLERLERGE